MFGLSDQILLAKIFLQQLQFVRQVSEEVNGTSVLYHRQQYQNVYFLMWNVLQQQYWHGLSHDVSIIFFSKHILFSFSSDFFNYQLNFLLFRQLETWIIWQFPFCFQFSCYFLSILSMLVTTYKVTLPLWKILMFIA